MSSPVKHTCPDIDKYIKWIKQTMVQDKYLSNYNEKELFDTASSMNYELENCIGYLEELRASNGMLREWGEGLDSEVENSASIIDELQLKVQQLEEKLSVMAV